MLELTECPRNRFRKQLVYTEYIIFKSFRDKKMIKKTKTKIN